MKKVKVTQAYINQLKSRNEYLEKELKEVTEDRQKFRDYFLRLLKDNVSMASENKYYSANTMILELSKLMNKVKNWYWA